MRKVIVSTLVTLDGVIEDPGGFSASPVGGWAGDYFGPEAMQRSVRRLEECEFFLSGRLTYESFSRVWPQASGPYAERLNQMPKLVASTTLGDGPLAWNARRLGDAKAELSRIKAEPGGDIIIYGSPTLVATLLAHALVDQLDLLWFPIALGSGHRLFAAGNPAATFSLARREVLDGQIVACTYDVLTGEAPSDPFAVDDQTGRAGT